MHKNLLYTLFFSCFLVISSFSVEPNYELSKKFGSSLEPVGKNWIKRTVKFDNDYKLDPDTFETITNDEGKSVLNEDYSAVVEEFKEWCVNQEIELKRLFLERTHA